MMRVNAFGKLPVAVQTVLGLALVGYGVSSITLAVYSLCFFSPVFRIRPITISAASL